MSSNVNPPPADGGLPPPPAQPPATDPERDRLAADLARARSENDQLRRAAANPPQPRPPAPAPAPANNGAPDVRDFYKDPWGMTAAVGFHAANETVNRALAPMYDTLVATARATARSDDPELFDQLSADIELKMATADPTWKQNATVWKNAFNLVKGERFAELRKQAPPDDSHRAPAVHVRPGNGPAPPSAPNPPVNNAPKLTDEERRHAKRFGMTPERYAETRDKLFKTEAENPLGDIDKPGFFDGRITYRTEDLRKEQRDARRRREAAASR